VSGERYTPRVSSASSRGRGTVAWAGSGGASLDASTAVPRRTGGSARTSLGAGAGVAVPAFDSLVMRSPRFASSASVHVPVPRT
jgi:hypothetical protein